MDPQRGDKSIHVHREDIVRAAREAGIVRGDVMIFHSSLSSMGTVVGGTDTVIDGFLEAVGPEGTVCAPTLWYHRTDPPMDITEWDIHNSPSYPGALTEAFRLRPDSLRSNQPTHSVSAIGKRAEEITATHGCSGLRPCVFGDDAFAADSPWQKLCEWNAAYCFIGVDFSVNTMGHFVETNFAERILAAAPDELKESLEGRIHRFGKPGVWPRHSFQKMGERLAHEGLVRFSEIGSATFRCIRAKAMVDRILEILDAEPEQWFNDEFLEWLREAQTGSVSS